MTRLSVFLSCGDGIWGLVMVMAKIFVVSIALLSGTAVFGVTEIKALVCPEGCGIFVVDHHLAKLIEREEPSIRYVPIETKGYLDNIIQMDSNPESVEGHHFCEQRRYDDLCAPRGENTPLQNLSRKPLSKNLSFSTDFIGGHRPFFYNPRSEY